MNSKSAANNPTLIAKIVELIRSAHNHIWKTVNNTMVITYFEIEQVRVPPTHSDLQDVMKIEECDRILNEKSSPDCRFALT